MVTADPNAFPPQPIITQEHCRCYSAAAFAGFGGLPLPGAAWPAPYPSLRSPAGAAEVCSDHQDRRPSGSATSSPARSR